MSEIVRRLFDLAKIVPNKPCEEVMLEAAAEIQRLTTALENARKDALEEAAQICDKQEIYSRKIGEGDEEFWSSHHATAMKTASILAASIRSLAHPAREKAT